KQFPGENTYLADLVICILMELISAVEGLQDLAPDAHLLVPGLLLLLLLAEELRGDPGRDDHPEVAPLGRPRFEHARAGRRELGDVCGSARRSSGVDVHRIPVHPLA